jgi:hypothetical protein
LQDYIQRLMAEKADLDKRFHGMKDELITRLQNACAQRDEARAQVGNSLCWLNLWMSHSSRFLHVPLT